MGTELHDRLADLADDAPRQLDGAGLWQRARRRHRARQAGGAVAIAAAVVALVVTVPLGRDLVASREAPPLQPTGELHLPDHVYVPSPYSEGTLKAGEIGPLAVLGSAQRTFPSPGDASDGLFGVSAVDGTARFLDIPSVEGDWFPGLATTGATLSPDGTKIGFIQFEAPPDSSGTFPRAVGFGVYDTVSGGVMGFTDPKAPVIEDLEGFEIAFSGDSRYLLTNYSRKRPTTNTSDEFVAWDVETGERKVMEGPGNYWLPNLGSAPRGVVWARDHTVVRILPGGKVGEQRTVRLPLSVVTASWGPDDRAFSYIGNPVDYPQDHEPANPPPAKPNELFVGPTSSDLRKVELPAVGPDVILGWRDPTHVVVAFEHSKYAIVDVRTGSFTTGRVHGEVNFYTTEFARDLWANDLVPGVKPFAAGHPRQWGGWLLGGAVVIGLMGLLWWRRRRG